MIHNTILIDQFGKRTGRESFVDHATRKVRFPVGLERTMSSHITEKEKIRIANKKALRKRYENDPIFRERSKKRLAEASERRRKLYPERRKASQALRQKVRSGIIKEQPCQVCNNPKSDAHHEDYSKPFDVIWLCRSHHMRLHRGSLTI